MISLLSRLFIKDPQSTEARKAYGTLCSIVGIVLNVLLFAGKYLAGVISGSVAVTADAFNNLSDAGSSFITLTGFILSEKKPDSDHPFGHGRSEYLCGFVIAIAILFMGFELLRSSVDKILHPTDIETGLLATVILVVSIAMKLYMSFYNYSIGKRIDSAAMKATATDSLSDAIATGIVLLSMIITRATGLHIDGICGVLVSLFIFYAGITAARDIINPLLGMAPEKDFVDQIDDIVLSHDDVAGIHDLVVHDYGPGRCMISLHAEVPGDHDIYELHNTIDHIERELRMKLGCEAVIHMDPIETDNEEVTRMKTLIATGVSQIDEKITIHDFRMVPGPTRTNLFFDVVVPYDTKLSQKDIHDQVETFISNLDGNYVAQIQVEQSYV